MGFYLRHDFELEFSRSNIEFTISWPKMVWLPRNKKQIYRLNSKHQMWPMNLTFAVAFELEFSRSSMEFTISWPKMVQLAQNKCKQIGWTPCIICDHQIWPSPWHWAWIFKVKYGICYISSQKGSDCHKTKSKHIDQNLGLKCDHRIWHWPWLWLSIFKVKFGICYISVKMVWLPQNETYRYRLNWRPQWP